MGNFNKVRQVQSNSVQTYEGAQAYKKDSLSNWLNMLFSSFLEDRFYEGRKEQLERFSNLTQSIADEYGYTFVGKAAFFARNELGMRSISQWTAAWLNDKAFEQKRDFYRAFFHRPDDIAEVFAAIDQLEGKRSHALIRGAADYLSTLSAYSIGKYKMQSHQYNMYDLINLTHAHSSVIDAYKKGTLENPDTWEVKISTATEETRKQEWRRLVEEHKLGYMALIRNLNNILDAMPADTTDCSWMKKYLIPQIKNEEAIRKSLIFPYRLYVAYFNLTYKNPAIVEALDSAFRIAVKNMPIFKGQTAIILDVSGSMFSPISHYSTILMAEVGACFGISLALANPNTVCIKFGTSAKQFHPHFGDNVFHMIKKFASSEECGCSTQLEPALRMLKNTRIKFDRIFLISDFQVMDPGNYNGPYQNFGSGFPFRHVDYEALYTTLFQETLLYSFDLANYDNQILDSTHYNIHYCTALNDSVCKLIGYLEQGEDSLYSFINKIQF